MKIVITGAGGQLGNELRRLLSNGTSALGAIPPVYTGAQVNCLEHTELDITDLDAVTNKLRALSPDVIFNCAAYTNVDGCETNQDHAFLVNAVGARNLAMGVQAYGGKLVHVSTDYVFPGTDPEPQSEWHSVAPQNIYGYSKEMGERYVRDFASRWFIVRTSWLYGFNGNNFVKTILRLARERRAIKVVNDQVGNPTNAADIAYHLLKIACTDGYGVYHCTSNGSCSWYDFACEFLALAGIDCDVTPCTSQEFPSPTRRPAYSSLDNRMLRCTIGDEMRDWKDAINDFMQLYNQESGEFEV